jgi:ribosomal protein L40E
MSVNSEEDKVNKLYGEIGRKLYASYSAGESSAPDFTAEFEQIDACEKTIKDIRKKIMELKNVKLCQKCGAELAPAAMFCPKCGSKQEAAPPPPAPEVRVEEPAAKCFCPECGTEVTSDTAFCSNCGTQIPR